MLRALSAGEAATTCPATALHRSMLEKDGKHTGLEGIILMFENEINCHMSPITFQKNL